MSSVENYVPYQPNAQGFTEALLDLKSTMPTQTVFKVTGYVTTCFENITQGDAVYSRASDGFVGKAIANDTFDKAKVAGIAETTQSSGSEISVLYFLSAASAGSIVTTPPTTAGHYVTRVGEAGSTGQFIIKVEPPIELS